jgi:lipopolysaccharide assembly outer membrane protein LptD (OstA)
MKGAVQIKTDAVTIVADEADYYCGTGEIRSRGDVQIKILKASAKK